ncbi:MAG TPA: DUF58 domain-containing protein [Lacunisphaera sp.]|nr:DUF58 domain-containing protein [Lacunisphaera sp.]
MSAKSYRTPARPVATPPAPSTRPLPAAPDYVRPPVRPLNLEELAGLGSLPLRARVLADALGAGGHSSRRKGASVEFADYRDYQPGDDLRRIDWRLYGRTDRLHLRETHEETPLRVVLLLDVSQSMAFASRAGLLTKLDYARTLLGALALLLRRQREVCGAGVLANELVRWAPPSASPLRQQVLWSLLDAPPVALPTALPAALTQVLDVAPRRCLFVLASDFYEVPENLAPLLRRLHFERHDLLALQVADPAEVDFPFEDPAIFQDIESGDRLAADPAALARGYRERFARHRRAIGDLCAGHGFDALALRTDEAPLATLRDCLVRRLTRRRPA